MNTMNKKHFLRKSDLKNKAENCVFYLGVPLRVGLSVTMFLFALLTKTFPLQSLTRADLPN